MLDGGFFMDGALMVTLGVVTLNKTWLQAAGLLAALAAVYRIITAVAYGADLVIDAIIVEILITAMMLFASSRIQPAESMDQTRA
jgi:hypothetical protein